MENIETILTEKAIETDEPKVDETDTMVAKAENSASLKEQANLLLKKEYTIFNMIDDEIAMASKLDNVIERQSKLSYLGKLKAYRTRTN